MNKTYEQLIEFIINEQEDKARELFHQLVVEKSRSIYESIVDEEDFEDETEMGGNEVDGLMGNIDSEITSDEEGLDSDDMSGMDDMGDMGDEELEPESGELEDRVMDLESALDDLKAEFEQLMAGEQEEPEHDGMDDMGDMDSEEEPEETDETMVREYTEKVTAPSNKSEGGTVGTGGDAPTVNTQSIVAKKNDMGGTASNIAKGGAEQNPDGKPTPKASNMYTKGQGEVEVAGRNVNKPGGNGANKFFSKKETSYEKQHGKEGQTTDGKMPVSNKSVVGGKVR
jgi:hypothetical protein